MITVEGTIRNGTIILDSDTPFMDGEEVLVTITPKQQAGSKPLSFERLQALSGIIQERSQLEPRNE
jgi:hypothetical protein